MTGRGQQFHKTFHDYFYFLYLALCHHKESFDYNICEILARLRLPFHDPKHALLWCITVTLFHYADTCILVCIKYVDKILLNVHHRLDSRSSEIMFNDIICIVTFIFCLHALYYLFKEIKKNFVSFKRKHKTTWFIAAATQCLPPTLW